MISQENVLEGMVFLLGKHFMMLESCGAAHQAGCIFLG